MSRTMLLAVVLALGCARSPEPRYYVLSPLAGSELPGPPLRIELRRPELPSYLDRPQVVRRVEVTKLELAGNERWGAPLEETISNALIKNLAWRLPNSSVYSEGGSISATPDVSVDLELQKFELDEDGTVKLFAEVATTWTDHGSANRLDRYTLEERPRDTSIEAIVEAMGQLLAKLADSLSRSIRAQAAGV